jgi:cytochrome P450
MALESKRIPPGPSEAYQTSADLFPWIGRGFAEFGDIFRASIYGVNVYAVRDIRFARHVLIENWHNYVKGRFIKRIAFLMGNGLIVSEGELWKRQRRMIQPAFRPKSIAPLTRLIINVNDTLLAKWRTAARQQQTINLTREVSAMALEVILRAIFSDDYPLAAAEFKLIVDGSARDWAFAQAFRPLRKVIVHITDGRGRRSAAPGFDFLDALLGARDPRTGKPMSDSQIINEVLTLIVAGHETSAITLNWTWYLLAHHREVESKLYDEAREFDDPEHADLSQFPYSRRIIEESIRLYPAVWLMTRKALHDDWLEDYFVPAGTEIYLPPYFIQRNPALWDEPDRFDPDRFGEEDSQSRGRFATLPFSIGPRNCVGESFARLEMQLHLLMIARHLRFRHEASRPVELDAGVNLRNKFDFMMAPEFQRDGNLR